MPKHFTKDPDDFIDYKNDWSQILVGDPIKTSTWFTEDDIDIVVHFKKAQAAIIWVKNGNVADICTLTNRISTFGGRQLDRSIILTIGDK